MHVAATKAVLIAVQVTFVVVPRLNDDPEGGSHDVVNTPIGSDWEEAYVATTDGIPVVGLRSLSEGH